MVGTEDAFWRLACGGDLGLCHIGVLKHSVCLLRTYDAPCPAGRVQSVALRLVAERETEIQAFVPQHYWTVGALLQTPSGAMLQVCVPFSSQDGTAGTAL